MEEATGFNNALTVKHVNVNESGDVIPYVIYYRVVSNNYEDFGYDQAVSFNLTVTRLPIEVDIHASSGIKYGASGSKDIYGYPTSAEIKAACLDGEHGYYAVIDGVRQSIDLSGTMEFYLTNAEEGKKLQVNSYTVGHRVKQGADDKATNYNFIYNGIQTSQYVVEKAELHFEWTVWDESEWGMNGTKPTYVYDDTSADKMLTASGATSGGKITIRPKASEVYYGDVIEPQVELRHGSAGSEQAFDRNVGDKVVSAHLRIGGGNIANYDLKTNWVEFEIVKRPVNVKLKGATYTYGTLSSASSSETGLGELSRAQKRWEYAAGNEYEFVTEAHHRAYGTFTPAKADVDGQYVDVGRYPLYAGPLYTGEDDYDIIYGNYNVVFSGSWSATDGPDGNGEFNGINYVGIADVIEITKATITRTIPLESEQIVYDGNAHTISSELFKTRLSNQTNNIIVNSVANAADMEVWFSNILASTTEIGNHAPIEEGLPEASESNSAWTHRSGTSPEMTTIGTYDIAVWIRGVKNYNDLVMGVYVQITPSSIIITLSGTIDAIYGDELYSDEELKEKVSDLVVSIKETGDSGTTYDNNSLKTWIKRFEVVPANGASMTSINDNVGSYTIRIAERNTIAEGFTLQFTTNGGMQNNYIVGAYQVNPRPLEINWSEWSFVYGEHSHPEITLNKVSEDDEIYIDMERDIRITNSDGGNTGVYNNHARDVGTYNAEVVSISGANGSSASASMCKYTVTGMNEGAKVVALTVTARPLTVKLKEQAERTYGEPITVIQALEGYLYQTPSTYEIISGSLANNASLGINDNNHVKDVFTISISFNMPVEYSNEYVSAGVYDIIGAANLEASGKNYDIKFVFGDDNHELANGTYVGGFTVNNAEIRENRNSKELIVYDGKEHDVIIREIGFILQGDGHVADENVGDGDMEDGVKNKLEYTISYMQTTSDSNTKPSVDDTRWTTSWKVKNAGDYYNYIKVTAANHNPYIWKVSQTVARVDLLVNVSATSVTYGDEVPEASALSSALNPVYKFTYDGKDVVVENGTDILEFKVVGQGGETALSGILNAGTYRVVCYANDNSDNYNITYADLESGDNKCNAEAFVVNKKQLTVSRDEFDYSGTAWQTKTTQETVGDKEVTVYSYIYDGKVPEITVRAEGALDKDNVTVIKTIIRLDERLDRVEANAYVGLYALELSIAASGSRVVNNYEIPQSETLYYRIEPREVEIEIGDRLTDNSIGDKECRYGTYKGNVQENGSEDLVHQHNDNDELKNFLDT
ncbi:MAG: hypothetical protein K2I79_03695, partial [Clostridia bacterium]|nr:hypothetical protein [Clostridia bacterium]